MTSLGPSRGGHVEVSEDLPTVLHNSVRTATGRLDSTPLEVELSVSAAFVARAREVAKEAARAAAPGERPARGGRERDVCESIVAHAVCEILYFDGTLPQVYSRDGAMTPLEPMGIVAVTNWNPEARSLALSVRRNFPLSSVHAHRPFKLAFVFFGDARFVAHTTAFSVLQKMGVPGTRPKMKAYPKRYHLTDDRRAALRLLLPSAPAADVVRGDVVDGDVVDGVRGDVVDGSRGDAPAPRADTSSPSTVSTRRAASIVLPASVVPAAPAGLPAPRRQLPCRAAKRRRPNPGGSDGGDGSPATRGGSGDGFLKGLGGSVVTSSTAFSEAGDGASQPLTPAAPVAEPMSGMLPMSLQPRTLATPAPSSLELPEMDRDEGDDALLELLRQNDAPLGPLESPPVGGFAPLGDDLAPLDDIPAGWWLDGAGAPEPLELRRGFSLSSEGLTCISTH